MNRGMLIAVVVVGLAAACHRQQAPTPEVERPALQRPTVTLRPAGAGKILSIPPRTLVVRAGVPGVFVVRDGRARFIMVKTGRVTRERVEILAGLHGDEVLVAGDLAAVRDGTPLKASD